MAVGVSALGAAAYLTGFRPRSQIFGPFPYAAETEEKIVALSFDDGPNEPYTSQLLEHLGSVRRQGDFLSGRSLRITLSVQHPASRRERSRARQPQLQPLVHPLSQAAAAGDRDQPLPRGVLFDHRPDARAVSPAMAVPLAVGAGQSAAARTSGGVGNLRPSFGDLPAGSRQAGRFGRTAHAPGHDLDLPRWLRGARRSSRPERVQPSGL